MIDKTWSGPMEAREQPIIAESIKGEWDFEKKILINWNKKGTIDKTWSGPMEAREQPIIAESIKGKWLIGFKEKKW